MKTLREKRDTDAGSRMHMLDWLESPQFLPTLRGFVETINFVIQDNAARRPRDRNDHRESVLVGRNEPFLSQSQRDELCTWWVVHRRGAKLPTWDLVISASDASGRPALVLIEAKAHAIELSKSGKAWPQRRKPEQQARSVDNHEKIGRAICEASVNLARTVPGILLSRDKSYQFANRIAFAWKLASLGIPIALIYLGFIGDGEIISHAEDCFRMSNDWQDAFRSHTAGHFPAEMHARKIDCGAASFWLLVRDMQVLRQSPPIEKRRFLL
jgi:hypothetical protein